MERGRTERPDTASRNDMLQKVLFQDQMTELPGLAGGLRLRAQQRIANTG